MLEETLIKWRDEIIRETRQETRREALRETRREVRREVLLEQMTIRFGPLPQEIRTQVEQITSTAELRKLARRVLKARSLQEMGLH